MKQGDPDRLALLVDVDFGVHQGYGSFLGSPLVVV